MVCGESLWNVTVNNRSPNSGDIFSCIESGILIDYTYHIRQTLIFKMNEFQVTVELVKISCLQCA